MKQKKETQQSDILKQITEDNISPIYLLYGEEEFLIDETLGQMIELLAPGETRDFNLEIYNGLNVSVEEIITSAETYPVMSDRRVIVIKEPTFFKGNKGLSGLDILRNAIEAYETDNLTKMMTLLAKVLELPADRLVEYDEEVKNAISRFIEDNKEALSPEEIQFLSNLKDITAKADVRPTAAGADEITRFIDWLSGSLPDSSVLILTLLGSVDRRSKLFKAVDKVGETIDLTLQKSGYGLSLESDQVYQMVRRKLQESGKSITNDAYVSQAIETALNNLEGEPSLAILFSTVDYDCQKIVTASQEKLGGLPLWGESSSAGIIGPGGFAAGLDGALGIMLINGIQAGVACAESGEDALLNGFNVAKAASEHLDCKGMKNVSQKNK